MIRILTTTIALGCLVAAGAQAQVGTPGSRAGGSVGVIPPVSSDPPTGKTPATTGSATPTGRVKPPGSPLGGVDDRQAQLDRRQQELDRRIRTGICRGC